MDPLWKTALWRQFGAAIDMLENALVACPTPLWKERLWRDPPPPAFPPQFAEYWYVTFMRLSGSTCISQASRRRNLLPLLPLPKGS